PANPSGKVWTRAELELVSEFAKKHELFVFTDEIYEHLVYDDRKHVAPATVPGLRDRTITISGFSKTFSITGWRVGFAACDRRWAGAIGYFHDLAYICAPSVLQHGVAAGLRELSDDFYSALAMEYLAKRDVLCAALRAAG